MNSNENTRKSIVLPAMQIVSLFSFFSCFLLINESEKQLLAILPLSFFVISLLFKENFKNVTDNIARLIIQSLFFVRLSVLPFLYSFVSDIQLFEGRVNVAPYINISCWLMAYEYLVVQLVIYLHLHSKKNRRISILKVSSRIDISSFLIVTLGLYILSLTVFLPQYTEGFKSILQLTDAYFTVGREHIVYSTGTIGRVLKTLYSMGFQIFRILFPAYLIRRQYIKQREIASVVITLTLCCIAQFFFLTSTFAEAVVSCLVIILYYISLYPEKKKETFLFLVACTVGVVIAYFVIRYYVNTEFSMYRKGNGAIAYAAQIINAYFTGVDNVAATFNIEVGHRPEALKADILGAIPFNSTLFGNRGNKLQYFYNLANSSYGQIPPTIGAGFYFFGAFLSPAISALFVKLSLKYYDRSLEISQSLRYIAVIFCSIVFALGTVMYSPAISLSWYFSWGIPMLVLTAFTGDY